MFWKHLANDLLWGLVLYGMTFLVILVVLNRDSLAALVPLGLLLVCLPGVRTAWKHGGWWYPPSDLGSK